MTTDGGGDDAGATRSRAPEVMTSERPVSTMPVSGDFVLDEPEKYVIETQIGAGGMGVVVAARGERLGRPVAVKMITADREELVARFDREARFTARLQHPAIVPVYGSGRNRDGRPFYAMKHVTGKPLDQLIASTPTLDQRIALLPHVIAVSEAIAYAHAERVIHRDLKPANILVGNFGETVVIDWGLAKELGEADPDGAAPYRDAPASGTAYGKVMGTPAFMPVEQACGEAVDERADVYALGAILYTVLAGRPPFARAGEKSVPWETMLARVLASSPEPLDEIQPGVPPDLVAIVKRAMAAAARDRYPSAGELATDLKRFQTGQLVGAHRYSRWQLLRRWVRRNRIAVTVGAIALAVLAVGAFVSVSRILREEARAEEQRAAAVKSRDAAEDLMSYMLGNLRDRLQPLGKLDVLDDVAKKAITYYAPVDPAELSDVELDNRSHALRNLGDVLKAQGHADQALVQYQASLELAELVHRRTPTDQNRTHYLANAHEKMGDVYIAQARFKDALAEMHAVLELDTQLAAAEPASHVMRREVGNAHEKIGEVLYAQGDRDAALAEFKTWIAIATEVAQAEPDNRQWQRDIAQGQTKAGDTLAFLGRLDEALAADRAALAIGEALAATAPDDVDRQHDLAVQHEKVGDALLGKGDASGAIVEYRADLAVTEAVATRDPSNADRQNNLAIAHLKIGDVLRNQTDNAKALVEYEAALAIMKPIAERDATSTARKRDLGVAYERVGMLRLTLNQLDLALQNLQRSTDIREQLVKVNPTSNQEQENLEIAYGDMMQVLQARGDAAGALAAVRREAEVGDHLAVVAPADVAMQLDAASGHSDFGVLLNAQGDFNGAVDQHRKVLAILEPYSAREPDNFDRAELVAGEHRFIAEAMLGAHDTKGALVEIQALCKIVEGNLAKRPDNLHFHEAVRECHKDLGFVATAANDKVTAEKELRIAYDINDKLLAKEPANAVRLASRKEIAGMLATCCKVQLAP